MSLNCGFVYIVLKTEIGICETSSLQFVALLKSQDLPEGIAHVNVLQIIHKPSTKVKSFQHIPALGTNYLLPSFNRFLLMVEVQTLNSDN